ncbi:MAG: hypothetical protein LUI39_04700 [Lachnospiraceae bacterium]|nr:hypothetical protein [Lachnospiraceae bacterium]
MEKIKWNRDTEDSGDGETSAAGEVCAAGKPGTTGKTSGAPGSRYLVACEESGLAEYQKQLLYDVLGPVFFGQKQAGSREELAELFKARYGIDVQKDFCEGDEHYDEYCEAQQAIAEGMSIYGGQIAFGDSVLAELAGTIWENLERQETHKFRRINTMLEE